MSRIGKNPVIIPAGVEVTITDAGGVYNVRVKGPKGTMVKDFFSTIKIEKKDDQIVLNRNSEEKKVKALHGTYRALINNMITGVTKGFERQLSWEGVGYKILPKGKGLTIQMGYSHDVDFSPVEGINFKIDGNTLVIEGLDRELVGQVAANIRKVKEPEPYKGKGIKYSDENIIRKAGKAAK